MCQTAHVEPDEELPDQSAGVEHERRPQQGAGAVSDRQRADQHRHEGRVQLLATQGPSPCTERTDRDL